LPEFDTYINREQLNEYNGENVKLIMNGWFLHKIKNWPPSNKINPLFLSFHLNSDAYEILDNPIALEYFKKNEPIGCRDLVTTGILLEKGIRAYFSGCLTLTLGEKYKTNKKNNIIYFVDPYFEYKKDLKSILKYTQILIFNYRKINTICLKFFKSNNLKNLLIISAFYIQYIKKFESKVLVNAEYITHMLSDNKFRSEIDKFEHAKMIINKYASAKFVITSKIHCALPCLGLETPVIYIDNVNKGKSSACRLDGLIQLFNTINYENGELKKFCFDFNSDRIGFDNIVFNKKEYLKYKENLISKCKDFLQ
jgi:hypothetical protein